MPKPTPKQIDEELQKQDDEVYGTDYTDGSHDKFDDTEEMVEEVIGNKPKKGKPFDIAEEVEEDEQAIKEGSDTPGYPLDEDESEED